MLSGTLLSLSTLPILIYLPLLSHVIHGADGSWIPGSLWVMKILVGGGGRALPLCGLGIDLGSSPREILGVKQKLFGRAWPAEICAYRTLPRV